MDKNPEVLKRLEKLNLTAAETIEKYLEKSDGSMYLDQNLLALFKFTTEHTLYVENDNGN